MKKQYFLIFFALYTLLVFTPFDAQNKNAFFEAKDKIEGLSIYPNPVATQHDVVYISSKQNLTKNIKIFSVLGKQVLSTKLVGKALNISRLNKGVYILNITENNISETRKLVIQ
ncbi:T9SS type A sorting domain-containing protein [Algibacter sp. Ld11]|uniref:T9SS type A sorting domain-containing protein n=1 Tax=Algibacter sp. Ld11 TaxID=649150 RepID=UPI00386DBAF5